MCLVELTDEERAVGDGMDEASKIALCEAMAHPHE